MQKILHGKEARKELLTGVNILTDVVRVTLGPGGKNVAMNVLHGMLRSTKDGVSCAREVAPDNPFFAAGAKFIREAAQKTADKAGDSTTTTTILAAHMCNAANELINKGYSPVELRKGIESAVKASVAWIKENATAIAGDTQRIGQIANISANNNDEIGNLIAEAFSTIGQDGVISMEDNYNDKCEIEIVPGYTFARGMINPYFITNEVKSNCELESPIILFYDKKITKIVDLLPVLRCAVDQQKPLLIICSGMEGEALGTLIANKVQKGLQVCVVMAPDQGSKRAEFMQDMAIFSGGEVISEDKGTSIEEKNFNPSLLGQAAKVIITKEKTTIVDGKGSEQDIIRRQIQIREKIAEASSDMEREELLARAASIGKGCAILKIGANTEIEKKSMKDLAEDAILSVRSAIEEGYLPGGGLALIRCNQALINKDTTAAELLVYNSFFEILYQILVNNGVSFKKTNWFKKSAGQDIVNRILLGSYDIGYNAKTERFSNLSEDGVIDAAKIIRCAIENAASVASIFLSTEVLISEVIANPAD